MPFILEKMEHGHANHLADDWPLTVYWYQKLPSKPFGVLPVEKRIPHVAQFPEVRKANVIKVDLSEDMKEAFDSARNRMKLYMKEKDAQMKKKLERTPGNSADNIKHSKRIRNSFK